MGYKNITYHNKVHGTDVCQTAYYFATSCGLIETCQFDDVDLFSLFMAGAIHDYEHPGLNNDHLVKTSHPWAIQYNDVSVLENHHVAGALELTKTKARNIFEKMS